MSINNVVGKRVEQRRPPKKPWIYPEKSWKRALRLTKKSLPLWECLLTGLGTLTFNQDDAGSNPVTPTMTINRSWVSATEISDDEISIITVGLGQDTTGGNSCDFILY